MRPTGAPHGEPYSEPQASASSGCDGFDILSRSCGGAACHGSEQSVLSAFAASPRAALALTGQTSALCAGLDDAPLVFPEDPAASLVMRKLTGVSTCGLSMPLGASPLAPDEVQCLEDWMRAL